MTEIKVFPRIKLAVLPTPLCELRNVSREVGTEIWVKRDDLTGFAGGGNKVRKAEFLLADAQQKGADLILTAGAVQSNHSRVIAAGARMLGIECHLFLTGTKPDKPSFNLLLDYLSGATVHFTETAEARDSEMMGFAEKQRSHGRVPYIIGVGGSNPTGAWGYAEGFRELEMQLQNLPPKLTTVVFASSSGGTHAGLLAGKLISSSKTRLLGIRVDSDPGLEKTVCSVATGCLRIQGMDQAVSEDELHLNGNYVGDGYGIPTMKSQDAFRRLWHSEGILLDLVYTAKAMAGLIDLAQHAEFSSERVVFLHTGGTAAFFGSTTSTPLETLLSSGS